MLELSKIPNGPYCYDENGRCPYWGSSPDHEEQDNGYCTAFNIADWIDGSLLWDQVKSCDINLDEEND